MRYLEKNYPEELKELNFGKKNPGFGYTTTPVQGKNVIRFIFSKNHLNDPGIKSLQGKIKTVILLSILWLAGLIYVIISYP